MATDSLHYSTKLGRYARCVAKQYCEYGDAHTSPLGLAKAGGAALSTHGHGQVQTVSPLVDGVYSIGTERRRETFREDGSKLTASEAEQWKANASEQLKTPGGVASRLSPTLLPSLGWGDATPQAKTAPRAKAGHQRTSPLDFQLAEHSNDPGVLAQLAQSPDPAVRLVVANNPATALDTMETLAVSKDQGWKLYSNAAHVELGHRYQDLRDEAEQAACERMEADTALQARLQQAPNYRQLVTMPAKRWKTRPVKQRRRIVEAAFEETAKLAKLSLRFGGWTARKSVQVIVGKSGGKLAKLPRAIALRSSREILSLFGNVLGSMVGSGRAQKRLTRQLGLGWLLA